MKQRNHNNINLPSEIHKLIDLLHSYDGAVRKSAREKLIRIGKSVVPLLLPLLSHKNELVRWEACKTLEKLRDPRAASALAEMLLDDDMDVRWVAADALIELEHHAICPVLEMIEEHFDSVLLRESAHHVLRSLKEMKLLNEDAEKVLEALSLHELPTRAAFAATRALDYLRMKNYGRVHRFPATIQ